MKNFWTKLLRRNETPENAQTPASPVERTEPAAAKAPPSEETPHEPQASEASVAVAEVAEHTQAETVVLTPEEVAGAPELPRVRVEETTATDLADAGTEFYGTAKPEPNPPVVEFRNVTKQFQNGFTAIKDVNFVVENRPDHGEFVSVLGPSGCGKSTILRLIAGLEPHHPATTGQVLVGGKPVSGPGADRGFVFQDYTSFDNRTVEDNVAFGLECQGVGRKERIERAHEWIEKVGLSVKRDARKFPHQLSGGMRQRVAIARSLILKPKIILMDEPFGALDPSTRLNMQDLLVKLWREEEATVFFITHSVEEAVYLGDRVYVMSPNPGTILQEIEVPPPDFPAKEMQRSSEFIDIAFEIRDLVESLETSSRAGD